MLLFLQIMSLLSLSFGQFYNPYPSMANDGMAGYGLPQYSPGSAGDSETLPISQSELAQLMAQSLASSSGDDYAHRPPSAYRHQREKAPNDESATSNYDGGEDEGSVGTINHSKPEEYANDGGQYGQQEQGEVSPYQQHEGQQHEGQQHEGQQEDSQQYQQPEEQEQTYRDGGYQNAPPNYQQDGGSYQSGQYPESSSSSYGPQGSEGSDQESQPTPYDGQSGSQYGSHSNPNRHSPRGQSYSQNPYNPQSGYQSNSPSSEYRGSAAGPHRSRGSPYSHSHDSDSSYSGPGSGYSGPGSDSFLSYNIDKAPVNKYYRK